MNRRDIFGIIGWAFIIIAILLSSIDENKSTGCNTCNQENQAKVADVTPEL